MPERSFVARTIPLSVTLAVVIAGFVGLTAILILIIVWSTTSASTRSLLASNGHWLMASVEADIRNQFSPTRDQIKFLVEGVDRQQIDPANNDEFISIMKGALAAAPQVRVLSFTAADGAIVGVTQGPKGIFPFYDAIQSADERQEIEEARNQRDAYWGSVYFVEAEALKTTVVNIRQSAFKGDKFQGLFTATITINALSEHLKTLAASMAGSTPFILYGKDRVLAHPAITTAAPMLSKENPLPTIDAVGDPFLQEMWKTEEISLGDLQAMIVNRDGESRVIVHRQVASYSPEPLTIGVEMPIAVLDPLNALWWAGISALGLLVLAVVIAIAVSQLIVRPIKTMARQSRAVAGLNFSSLNILPPSRFSELNEQVQAYNSMLTGLKWLEAYVPKPLVRRLIESGVGQHMASEDRIVTVMFVDIAGFTIASEHMQAADVADMLNEHFDLIGSCIEQQNGTIDKFIGDGLMAFWGAPEDQPDHADRAVRAAELISHTIKQGNQARSKAGLPARRIRIGIHTGPVVVGNIGMSSRLGYTIVGDTVNVASRLEQMGKTVRPEQDVVVTLSASTHKALTDHTVIFERLGLRKVPGRKESIEVYCQSA